MTISLLAAAILVVPSGTTTGVYAFFHLKEVLFPGLPVPPHSRARPIFFGALPQVSIFKNVLPDTQKSSRIHWFKYASPQNFFMVAGKWLPWFAAIAVILGIIGLYIGFFVAPTDHQQGDAYRIIFLHVPAAWMSMFIYLMMAFWAAIGLAFNTRISSMMASALAPTGAMFAFLALWTGALWGKPTWGAWWVWDARLTSELILLFLYVGFMALQAAIDEPRRADKAGAVLALVGVINVPVIYFSVQWWNTLHQGSSLNMKSAPTMAMTMLLGMLVMALAFWAYTISMTLLRVRCIVLERERHTDWVKQYIEVIK